MKRKSFVFLTALLFVAIGMLGCGDDPATSTIVITNVKNNATLEAGFLTGHVSGATALSYEVSWDDGGSWTPVAGTAAFRIRIPLSWRSGWYYSFRIRAVTSGGPAGDREFTVRKGVNRDWNGDGYPDLVIGEPAWDSYTGRVNIFNGGPGGPAGTASLILPLKINTATEGDRSPNFIQEDFNGDGYGDIAFFDCYGGMVVRIYSGSSNQLVQTSAISNGSLTSKLAAGDFNGDGYIDLAVSSDGSPTRRVIVFLSEGTGGIPGTDLSTDTADWQTDGADTMSVYGSSLATGDFDRDGYDDLAVGEKYMTDTPGSVHVFHGSGTGLAGSPAVSLTGPANGSRFGDTAVAGDFNGDGYADLAVGAFALDFIAQDVTNCGYAAVYHGGASGIAATPAWTNIGPPSSKFGAGLAAGDTDGDGHDDLAVHAGGQQIPGVGSVTLFRGSSDGLATVSSRTITGETNGNYFGAYLHCSDLNGDGYADLYVQDDGYDWDGSSGPYLGKVYWFRGRATGIGSDPDWSLTLYLSED